MVHGTCVYDRALNEKTVKDKLPIPIVEQLLDELRDAQFFTKLYLRSSYHQVLTHLDDMEMTAFHTHQGLFKILVMPFGLTNAPTTFQTLMKRALQPFLRQFVLVFFDDILIYNKSWSKHLRPIHLVLTKLQEHQLFMKKSKCTFRIHEVAYLNHVISTVGIAMDGQKVHAFLDWPIPRLVRVVHAFLALVGYY
jgi:hypothetical protein